MLLRVCPTYGCLCQYTTLASFGALSTCLTVVCGQTGRYVWSNPSNGHESCGYSLRQKLSGTPDAMDRPSYNASPSGGLTTGMCIGMSSGTIGYVSHADNYMDTPLYRAKSWKPPSPCRLKHGTSGQAAWPAGRRHRSCFPFDSCCDCALYAQGEETTRSHQQGWSVHRRDFTDRIGRIRLDFRNLRHHINPLWVRQTPG